jgi:CPA2 family monovalent cation:H+ antiporter-2
MHNLPALIYDLAIILMLAGIATLLFQRIKQPIVLGYLVAGIIVGPYTPPHALLTDIPNIKILSELGVIFLMFSLGLEFSFHKLARVGFSAGITGLFEVILMTLLGFAVGKLIGWSFYDSLFLGAALSISSTVIIIKAIEELNLSKKRFVEIIIGVLVVEDLLAILLLVALSTMVLTQNIFSAQMAWAAGKLILVVSSWFIFGYFLIPPFLRKIMQYANAESLTVVAVGLCLFLVAVAAKFHYSSALGAFIMGSILAETDIIQRIQRLIKPIRDIFAAVFFVSVGMLMDPAVLLQHWPLVLLITAVTIVGKLVTSGLGALLTGQTLNTSLRVGFGMAQVGEFSFIIIGLGVALNVINNSLYPIIVAVSIITTFTTPYLMRFSLFATHHIDTHLSHHVHDALEKYAALIYRVDSENKQASLLSKTLGRLIINSILVIIIFTLTHTFVLPWVRGFFVQAWIAPLISWVWALILSSPFIWGILFAFKTDKTEKPKQTKLYLNSMIIFLWLATIIEISILSNAYFHAGLLIILFTFFYLTFFIFAYRRLEKIYQWLECQLVQNIKKRKRQSN